ncbi:transposase [Neobacillus sp. LXY-1]|uniref:transposase n=1 Tax=Neobacillus sp. LXY-1 TaxID=3379133 RepID=UPI003EE204E1
MARRIRTWHEGAKFHVTSRGNNRMKLFLDDEDFNKYLSILKESKARFPFVLHAYCLMTNHTHLQIDTLETPISTIMKYLNTSFAKYFNKKYTCTGHVFEKRYSAELLNSPEYEIDVSKYIHLNPVTAGITETPEDYPWSSYPCYVYGEIQPLVDPTPVLSYFPNPSSQTYENYMKSRYTDKFHWYDGKIYFIRQEESLCGLE